MKRKIFGLFILICSILLVGCTEELTPKDAVRDYLEKYVTLDDSVVKQLDEFVVNEDLSDEQKELYKEVLKRHYSSLTYTLETETIEDDIAYVDVKINVINLYKVQKASLQYLEENKDEFNDELGVYDKTKFLDYKLEQMKNADETISYNIKFKVIKNGEDWNVSQLSNEDLEKLHGIYNYEEE